MAGVYWALLGLLRAQADLTLGEPLRLLRRRARPAAGRRAAAWSATFVASLRRGRGTGRRSGRGNFGSLRNGSLFLQEWSGVVLAELGALELAGARTDPLYRPDPTRLPPVTAGAYFASVRDLGSPADTPEELLARSDGHRQIADNVLVQALPIVTEPVRALPASGCRTVREAGPSRRPWGRARPSARPARLRPSTACAASPTPSRGRHTEPWPQARRFFSAFRRGSCRGLGACASTRPARSTSARLKSPRDRRPRVAGPSRPT